MTLLFFREGIRTFSAAMASAFKACHLASAGRRSCRSGDRFLVKHGVVARCLAMSAWRDLVGCLALCHLEALESLASFGDKRIADVP